MRLVRVVIAFRGQPVVANVSWRKNSSFFPRRFLTRDLLSIGEQFSLRCGRPSSTCSSPPTSTSSRTRLFSQRFDSLLFLSKDFMALDDSFKWSISDHWAKVLLKIVLLPLIFSFPVSSCCSFYLLFFVTSHSTWSARLPWLTEVATN